LAFSLKADEHGSFGREPYWVNPDFVKLAASMKIPPCPHLLTNERLWEINVKNDVEWEICRNSKYIQERSQLLKGIIISYVALILKLKM
jgi:hypothetical protein